MKESLHSADYYNEQFWVSRICFSDNIMFPKGQWYCTLGKGNVKNRGLVHKRPKKT